MKKHRKGYQEQLDDWYGPPPTRWFLPVMTFVSIVLVVLVLFWMWLQM